MQAFKLVQNKDKPPTCALSASTYICSSSSPVLHLYPDTNIQISTCGAWMAPHAQGYVGAKQGGRQVAWEGAAVSVGMTLLMGTAPWVQGCCTLLLHPGAQLWFNSLKSHWHSPESSAPAVIVLLGGTGARWGGLPGTQALVYQQSVCSSNPNPAQPQPYCLAVSRKSETL